MLQLIWFLVATPALGCDQQTKDYISLLSATLSIDPESWVPPPTEGMECIRGYSNCWAPGSSRAGCTYEYSTTDLDICSRHSLSIVAIQDNSTSVPVSAKFAKNAPGLIIDGPTTVKNNDENFDEALWNKILTPRRGCAVQDKSLICDIRTTDCRSVDYSDIVFSTSEETEEQECNGFFVNTVILDIDPPKYDPHNANISRKIIGKIFGRSSSSVPATSSVTLAWTTSLPNNKCMSAYNVCWGKQNTPYVGCRRDTFSFKRVTTSSRADTANYQITYAILQRNSIESGAARLLCSSLTGITTMVWLRRIFM